MISTQYCSDNNKKFCAALGKQLIKMFDFGHLSFRSKLLLLLSVTGPCPILNKNCSLILFYRHKYRENNKPIRDIVKIEPNFGSILVYVYAVGTVPRFTRSQLSLLTKTLVVVSI